MNRPNDQRAFVHKRILGAVGGFAGAVLSGGNPILGAARGFTGGGQRTSVSPRPSRAPRLTGVNLPFSGAPGAGFDLFGSPNFPRIGVGERNVVRTQASRFPGDNPLETQVAARNFAGTFPTGDGGNGLCPDEPRICPPRGFHINKSSYFLRDGTFIPRGSKFVRNRRLNNANGRAQGKAIVRLEKGAENAKKLLKATGWRTISKQSSRELRMRKRTGHR